MIPHKALAAVESESRFQVGDIGLGMTAKHPHATKGT